MATKIAKRPTSRKSATRKPTRPTKLQRMAKEVLDQEGQAEPVARRPDRKSRKRSLAYRASRRIGTKHRVLRVGTYAVVGLGVGVAKSMKWTAIGTGRATRWGSRRLVDRLQADVHKRKWVPELPRPRTERWYQRSMRVSCVCGKHYSSIERLNRHLVEDHRGEAKVFDKPRPKVQRGHTRRSAGKTIVRPKVAGGGRHRARHALPDARRVADILAAYETHLNKIKEAAVTLSSFQRAADELAELRPNRRDGTTRRSDFYEQLREIEVSFATLGDGVSSYARTLRSERGYNIDPAIVGPFERNLREAIDLAAQQFTQFIATFEDVYRLQIKAEGGDLSKPALNLGA